MNTQDINSIEQNKILDISYKFLKL